MSEPRFVIFDVGDDTYHCGGGHWNGNANDAEQYASVDEAKLMLDEIDCERLLRHRLKIRETAPAHLQPGRLA